MEVLIRSRTLCPDGTAITGGLSTVCLVSRTLCVTADRQRLRPAGAFLFLAAGSALQPLTPEYEYGKTRRTPRQASRHR